MNALLFDSVLFHLTFSASQPRQQESHALPDDQLCLVCGAHSSTSCSVCDENFCSNHLYRCLDCDNQYCGHCLDDHRTDGHWADSDTGTELNRGQRDRSVRAQLPVEIHGLAAAPNRTQCRSTGQLTFQSRSSAISAAVRNQSSFRPSEPNTLTLCTLLLPARITASACLAWLADVAFAKMFSQSEPNLEPCR